MVARYSGVVELGQSIEICVPDIGDFEEVEVVEILVAPGDAVAFDDPLVSVESDKATMEIPASSTGVVTEVRVSEGDKVSEGSVLVLLDADADDSPRSSEEATAETASEAGAAAVAETGAEPTPDAAPSSSATPTSPAGTQASSAAAAPAPGPKPTPRVMSAAASNPVPDRHGGPHASPLVRRYARELGVPVEAAEGTGPLGRVLVDDLKRTVRERFGGEDSSETSSAKTVGTSGIPKIPAVDFSAFGPVREEPLTRIQKVAGPGLHRSWLNVPHVTQHDEADVTELERFRKDRKETAASRGLKLSPLLFVMKAVVIALREFPRFRSSLAPEGDRLIVKDSYHLGIAVDTEQGLVVPVIRDVDRKGVFELAEEVNAIAERARARKLSPTDLSGACFTISSLGGIGGTAFTPIVNAPEVAILGLSKTRIAPRWQGPGPLDEAPLSANGEVDAGCFEPRLVLPLSLSYDHRVIDGAEAVRFTSRLSRVLADPIQLLL